VIGASADLAGVWTFFGDVAELRAVVALQGTLRSVVQGGLEGTDALEEFFSGVFGLNRGALQSIDLRRGLGDGQTMAVICGLEDRRILDGRGGLLFHRHGGLQIGHLVEVGNVGDCEL
jgi:hypothetical protein